ncbi:MAG: hypothetical protein DSY76_05945 [Bacteroidetes bacterium]|nr:MAG: hypothetical protein DSY76_05945 [Bacteroidota bacterium]
MKSRKLLLFVLSVGLLTVLFTNSCKKENSMDVVITVKLLSDTTQVVPGAHIVMSQGDIHIEGNCDQSGVFRHTLELPVVLNVVATKDSLQGIGSVAVGEYLEPAIKTIFVK